MKRYGIWLVALDIGIINAILLRLFELAVNNGTNWIWNDWADSDVHRWKVVPLAIGLGVVLTLVVHWLHEKRVVQPESDLQDDMNVGPVNLRTIGVILAIGLMSLLAGASLGPEASLLASSVTIGAWLASKTELDANKQLLVLASIGALLVAFLGSIVMVLVPLLLLYKQKQLRIYSAGVVVAASLTSIGMLLVIDNSHPGYGSVPPLPHLALHDFGVALVTGFVTTALALLFSWLIKRFAWVAREINRRLSWVASAILFGLVLSILYLLGGQTIQFSGSVGARLLESHGAQYGAAALLGLIVTKLLATAWSKATGYRGGLVFPSIYVGVALGLLIGRVHGGWGGAGATIGGIAGMLSAVTGSTVMAAVFVLAILPVKLLPVAIIAILGSAGARKLLQHSVRRHSEE